MTSEVAAGSGARGRSALPRLVILLGLTSLLTDIGTEMIFPLLPVFLVQVLHASPTFLGLIEGAADTVASLLKLLSGRYSDTRPRRKPLVVLGYGLASAVRPFVALATAPWHVLSIRIADRIGKGLRSSPRDAMIADAALPGEVGRAFGFHQAMDHAGAVVGPLLATALMAAGAQLRTVFWMAAIPGALATLVVASVREHARKKEAAARTRAAPDAAAEAPALPRALRRLLLILLIFSLGNSSDAFLLLRARDLGVETRHIPLLWMALNLSKLGSAYLGGVLSDRWSRVGCTLVGWFIYAAVYLGLGLASGSLQIWILLAVYGVYYGLTEPTQKALIKDIAPLALRGRAFGYYNFVVGVSALPAGLTMGSLWRSFGAPVAFETGAGLAALAGLLLALWSRRSRVESVGDGSS
jgi:MFS family permease